MNNDYQLAKKLLANGAYVKAYQAYRENQASNTTHDHERLLGMAICESRLDLTQTCLQTLEKLLLIQPDNIRALLLKAECHYKLSPHKETFQQIYQHAQSLVDNNTPKDALNALERGRQRVSLQRKLADMGLTEPQVASSTQRFIKALEINYGEQLVYSQNPSLFFYPGLINQEFFDSGDFEGLLDLENNYKIIAQELLLALPKLDFLPYLESAPKSRAENIQQLSQNLDWSACYLWKNGIEIEKNTALFKFTSDLLKKADIARLPGKTPNILFSKLKPNTHIPPHTGLLNTRLICHLPLIVPENCGAIRCGNQIQHWTPGKILVFDDSIEHEAWNCSDEERIVLIFEIWRPEVTTLERRLLCELIR